LKIRHRWEGDIKMDLKEWTRFIQNRIQTSGGAHVNMALILGFHKMQEFMDYLRKY
jgi:hypothetical protein